LAPARLPLLWDAAARRWSVAELEAAAQAVGNSGMASLPLERPGASALRLMEEVDAVFAEKMGAETNIRAIIGRWGLGPGFVA
jgi:hypothetical protein